MIIKLCLKTHLIALTFLLTIFSISFSMKNGTSHQRIAKLPTRFEINNNEWSQYPGVIKPDSPFTLYSLQKNCSFLALAPHPSQANKNTISFLYKQKDKKQQKIMLGFHNWTIHQMVSTAIDFEKSFSHPVMQWNSKGTHLLISDSKDSNRFYIFRIKQYWNRDPKESFAKQLNRYEINSIDPRTATWSPDGIRLAGAEKGTHRVIIYNIYDEFRPASAKRIYPSNSTPIQHLAWNPVRPQQLAYINDDKNQSIIEFIDLPAEDDKNVESSLASQYLKYNVKQAVKPCFDINGNYIFIIQDTPHPNNGGQEAIVKDAPGKGSFHTFPDGTSINQILPSPEGTFLVAIEDDNSINVAKSTDSLFNFSHHPFPKTIKKALCHPHDECLLVVDDKKDLFLLFPEGKTSALDPQFNFKDSQLISWDKTGNYVVAVFEKPVKPNFCIEFLFYLPLYQLKKESCKD